MLSPSERDRKPLSSRRRGTDIIRHGHTRNHARGRTDPLTLEQMQARCLARTSTDTDTVKIEIAGALIVVTDLTTGEVYYIQR